MNGFIVGLLFLIGVALAKDHWWQHANFYQIYPRSFKDSDGDGVGDLRGIMEKVGYLKHDLGIDAIWLSPIFKSPMADFGYDISNFTDIHPEFGTIADLENLAQECRKQNLKLILDFVPNHSSDEHEYFKKSEARDPDYKDYYVWHPGKRQADGTRKPPSNWISEFRGSAWELSSKRDEYYLHQFVKKQPDLNYRNPKVVEDMKNVLRFWLDKGVDGFRIDAVPYLFENDTVSGEYPDEPISNKTTDPENPKYLEHYYTQNHELTFDMVFQWRAVLDEYKAKHATDDLVLMAEAYTPLKNIVRLFGNDTHEGAHIPFNFEVLSNTFKSSTGKDFYDNIKRFWDALPEKYFANWVLGNHDNKRLASRLGVARADLYNIALNTLPHIAVTYNGEELAMEDVYIPWKDTVDPAACNSNPTIFMQYSRDPARTPFHWDDSINAGFSTAPKTWLPVSPYYKQNNYKLQKTAPRSHVKIFKSLLRLRKQRTLREGSFDIKLVDENLVMYKRELEDVSTIVVILNFHKTARTVNLSEVFTTSDLPLEFEIITSSLQTNYVDGSILDYDQIMLPADAGIVLEGSLKNNP
ncbi:probable maltase [Toxorhynchites rutilus septentrionalis]|uniref:probable maltase n=1 Tax=Toxorhynchites rutilus septentrionalis TaxID=329112 RepID=UPI00247AD404|nr:probable maltase [Toxorhynchites rutilus septentrionalis]